MESLTLTSMCAHNTSFWNGEATEDKKIQLTNIMKRAGMLHEKFVDKHSPNVDD